LISTIVVSRTRYSKTTEQEQLTRAKQASTTFFYFLQKQNTPMTKKQ
jgi:hypothetical protein